ncbi:MAG: mycothione reductase [Intrasporangium sp.]|uniref:mycothione reductase n=1 Tax=Intrasporangium sp. TaxID=1925024 RepID=UPI00264767E3|nr:mycothione reductase [Intrasporangium sp.]MDN5797191.1 mycothione reductase [Intrasporangium sp.]
MTEHFDLAIIGTGSGNSLVTPDFDDKRVAVIESGTFGGTCLNVGCIPTKMFVYAAEVADSSRGASRYGVDAQVSAVRWRDIRDRIFGRIDPIAASGRDYRVDGPNTTAYLGRARFTASRDLTIAYPDGRTAELTADQVVIATGAHAVAPSVIAGCGVPFHTSDTIMRIDELPEHLLVVGGGFIAAEMAHIFGGLGSRVTVIARGPRLLRHLDSEIAERFTEVARDQWDVRTGTTVMRAGGTEGEITLDLSDGTSTCGDLLLVATGRAPTTADLALGRAGVRTHVDGRVVVDQYGRTGAPGVWALGDCCSPYQLKHVANAEARAVAHNLAHPEALRPFPHRNVPSAVFSSPQIATIGLTEDECVAQHRPHVVKVQAYGDTAYGWAMEDTTSVCKVIADPHTGSLLGAHVMGPQASTLIQPLVQAMSLGTPARVVARDQYWIHPALAEVVENALLGLENSEPYVTSPTH